MSESKPKQKRRIALTPNQMPDHVFEILEKKAEQRKITPYIVSLVEKEIRMDKLISDLSILIEKVSSMEEKMDNISDRLDNTDIIQKDIEEYSISKEDVVQGDLGISDNIVGGIEEEVDEMDF